MFFSPAIPVLAATAALCCGLLVAPVHGQGPSSRGEEMSAALDAALTRIGRLEEEAARLRSANAALARSLAGANGDARASREELRALRADLEALGLSVFDPSDREARKRLIATMAEANREREARAETEQNLLQLSESVLLFLDKEEGVSPASRAKLEAALRSADRSLAATRVSSPRPAPATTDLSAARVVSLQPELGVAVLNVGRQAGVRVGMPFEFFRNDRSLGHALVVDARDTVCGVFPQENVPLDALVVGDSARPAVD